MKTDTPRCNALSSNPLDSFDIRAWQTLAHNLERDLVCTQENFRVTNQAYCKLDVETRELRGSAFAQTPPQRGEAK